MSTKGICDDQFDPACEEHPSALTSEDDITTITTSVEEETNSPFFSEQYTSIFSSTPDVCTSTATSAIEEDTWISIDEYTVTSWGNAPSAEEDFVTATVSSETHTSSTVESIEEDIPGTPSEDECTPLDYSLNAEAAHRRERRMRALRAATWEGEVSQQRPLGLLLREEEPSALRRRHPRYPRRHAPAALSTALVRVRGDAASGATTLTRHRKRSASRSPPPARLKQDTPYGPCWDGDPGPLHIRQLPPETAEDSRSPLPPSLQCISVHGVNLHNWFKMVRYYKMEVHWLRLRWSWNLLDFMPSEPPSAVLPFLVPQTHNTKRRFGNVSGKFTVDDASPILSVIGNANDASKAETEDEELHCDVINDLQIIKQKTYFSTSENEETTITQEDETPWTFTSIDSEENSLPSRPNISTSDSPITSNVTLYCSSHKGKLSTGDTSEQEVKILFKSSKVTESKKQVEYCAKRYKHLTALLPSGLFSERSSFREDAGNIQAKDVVSPRPIGEPTPSSVDKKPILSKSRNAGEDIKLPLIGGKKQKRNTYTSLFSRKIGGECLDWEIQGSGEVLVRDPLRLPRMIGCTERTRRAKAQSSRVSEHSTSDVSLPTLFRPSQTTRNLCTTSQHPGNPYICDGSKWIRRLYRAQQTERSSDSTEQSCKKPDKPHRSPQSNSNTDPKMYSCIDLKKRLYRRQQLNITGDSTEQDSIQVPKTKRYTQRLDVPGKRHQNTSTETRSSSKDAKFGRNKKTKDASKLSHALERKVPFSKRNILPPIPAEKIQNPTKPKRNIRDILQYPMELPVVDVNEFVTRKRKKVKASTKNKHSSSSELNSFISHKKAPKNRRKTFPCHLN